MQSYKMSFSTGGLFLNESVEVARLHQAGEDWEETLSRALDQGATNLPKAASNRRTLREIVNRISTLTDAELNHLVSEPDRMDHQALLWLATCRAYRFVREFAVEVIHERYLSYQLDLPLESFDILLDAKAEWDDDLSALSHTTRLKLRQVLFRMMREAGIINEQNQIQTALLSIRVTSIIEDRDPSQLVFFPGIQATGAG